MDVTSLFNSTIYMDNLRDNFRAPSLGMPGGASPVHSPENFQELLRRAYASPDTGDGNVSENVPYGSFVPVSPSGTARHNAPIDKNDKLYQLCLELETFIVKNLVNGMRSTVQKSGFIDDSFAGKMYEDLLYDEYAKEFTRNANFGLAEQAYRQLTGAR